MKPTPSKVVLLMSAAGLGLSWSGLALASRDSHTQPSAALAFGVAPRNEQGCNLQDQGTRLSCLPAGGELLRTIVAETAALPLPLAAMYSAGNAKLSFRGLDSDATTSAQDSIEAHQGRAENEPSSEAPPPNVPAIARSGGQAAHVREANAIAMVLLDDLQAIAEITGTGSELAGRPSSEPQHKSSRSGASAAEIPARELADKARGRSELAPPIDVTTATTAESKNVRVDSRRGRASVAVRISGTAAEAGVAVSPRTSQEAKSTEALASDPVGLSAVPSVQAGDRSGKFKQVDANTDPAPSDSASIERVFASLAEVLGSQVEEPRVVLPTSVRSPATPEHVDALGAAVAKAAASPVPDVSALPVGAIGSDKPVLTRSRAADDIVVVTSHSDKILLSLAALRSGEGSEEGQFGAQTKKTVVVRHTDKVLETLALFRSEKPKQAAVVCTEEMVRAVTPAHSQESGELPEQAVARTEIAARSAVEPDIVLDVLPPAAGGVVKPAQDAAAPAHVVVAEPRAASRNEKSAIGSDMVALSVDRLDEVRGGFVTDGGLKISFGIERAVYLNGNLVTTTSLNIADLAKISGAGAQVTGNGAGSLALLQSGVGNVFAPGSVTSTAAGTFIQNTLDNQKINTVTRIDAVVNSAGILRSMNLQSSMQSAVVNSLRR